MGKGRRTRLSKFMSLILRHRPEIAGIKLDDEGFADINELARAISRMERWRWVRAMDIIEISKTDEKSRFEIKGNKIRARYGHSIEVNLRYEPEEPPEFLYHGTSVLNLKNIKVEGLKPMGRKYVHLSPDEETALQVGLRHDSRPIILKIKAKEAFKKGIFFTKAGPKTYLSDNIPPEFILVNVNEG